MNHVLAALRQQLICARCDKHYNGNHGIPLGWKIVKLGEAEGLICEDCAAPPSRLPLLAAHTHKKWTVGPTAYLKNMSAQDMREETFALLYQAPPTTNANGTVNTSLRYPVAIGAFYLDSPADDLQQIADCLNAREEVSSKKSGESVNEVAVALNATLYLLDALSRTLIVAGSSWSERIENTIKTGNAILATLPGHAA